MKHGEERESKKWSFTEVELTIERGGMSEK
uniref:Uncharacterized protein n=1 Tax=Bursaphelenchus xylophilus TaxID=6326 RepID=A0A1I7SK76_BURXY